ncbi:hypothetical protein EGM88_10475 [Aureibaculum marinum]|uniref:DUF4595 domain-containing protein n=1 Tax=Aureibaculum marinum TaxID=2487930 RepID=A0A3N4NIK8_9FLAO|nr:hypothetical protein [Aureibaculum marinum]RPD96184.1 hypothetical protein EGM88_10475 [Aureibaculum marinum]
MKKYYILTIIISVLILTNCTSSDSDINDKTPKKYYRLVKETEYNSDGTIEDILTYSYNENGYLIKAVEQSGNDILVSNLNYIDNKISSIVYTGNQRIDFIYENNIISSYTSNLDGDNLVYKFTYNDNNQIINKLAFNEGKLSNERKFKYYSNGNLAQEIFEYNDGYTFQEDFEYDNKKNPHYLSYPLGLITIEPISENNVIKKTRVSSYPTNNKSIITFEYEYNDKGYPIKMIEYVDGDVENTTEYEYKEVD